MSVGGRQCGLFEPDNPVFYRIRFIGGRYYALGYFYASFAKVPPSQAHRSSRGQAIRPRLLSREAEQQSEQGRI